MARDESPQPTDPNEPEDDDVPADAGANGDEESRAADDQPERHLKIEKDEEGRSHVYKRGADGEWEEAEHRPVSDDPEVNAIGELGYEELEAIAADEDHPKHELAKEYLRLSSARLLESLKPLNTRLTQQYGSLWKNIIGKNPALNVMKGVKLPDTAKILPEPILPKSTIGGGGRLSLPKVPEVPVARNPAWDVLEEQRELNGNVLKTNEHLAEMVAQAKADAKSADDRAAEDRGHAKWSLRAAWAAVGVTVIVGIVQIIQNM